MTPRQLVTAHALMIQRIAKAYALDGKTISDLVASGTIKMHEVSLLRDPDRPLPFDLVVRVLSFQQNPADLIALPFSRGDMEHAMQESARRASRERLAKKPVRR